MYIKEIEFSSGEIDEVLGKPPNRIIRWGTSIILLVIIIVLVSSWFFKYPDTITSPIEIITLNPPANVIAKANGRIDSIYVKSNELVKEKQVLAIIENPAEYHSILLSLVLADSIKSLLMMPGTCIDFWDTKNNILQLGEFQTHFSAFMTSSNNLVNYIQLDYFAGRIEAIKKQIDNYRHYYNNTYDQQQTIWSDLILAENDYKRYQVLFESHLIAESDLEKSLSLYLSKKHAYESARASLANIDIQISQLENSILDLQMQNQQQKERLIISMNETYNNLKAQSEIWEQQFVLRAPQKGTCVFTKFWSKNQNVFAGETVMTIIPQDTLHIIGQLLLPIAGAGKVRHGQRVVIKLYNYPYMEYGMLEGIVQNISAIPHESHYFVEVIFPNGIITSYGIEIPFTQQMQGMAEVITDDIRLLHRVFWPIKYILSENW